jgi:hypothetical protein
VTRRGSDALDDLGDGDARVGDGRPADACPYARPFSARFRDCPAYQPAYFIALNTAYESMPPVWTCANLRVGAMPGRRGRFYGACRIGDEKARLEWVSAMRSQRLDVLRTMQRELAQSTAALASELWSAKGEQLQARPESPEWDAATVRLERLGARMLTVFEAFLEEHRDDLVQLDLPMEPLRRALEDLTAAWIAQPDASPPEISQEALERFPEDVRMLLQPDRG